MSKKIKRKQRKDRKKTQVRNRSKAKLVESKQLVHEVVEDDGCQSGCC